MKITWQCIILLWFTWCRRHLKAWWVTVPNKLNYYAILKAFLSWKKLSGMLFLKYQWCHCVTLVSRVCDREGRPTAEWDGMAAWQLCDVSVRRWSRLLSGSAVFGQLWQSKKHSWRVLRRLWWWLVARQLIWWCWVCFILTVNVCHFIITQRMQPAVKKRQHKQYNHKTRKIKADWHADTVCSQIVRPFFSYDTYQRNILKTDERFWRQLAHVVHGQGRETFNFRNSGGERSRSHAAWFSTPWVECFSSWLTNFCCNYFRQRRR